MAPSWIGPSTTTPAAAVAIRCYKGARLYWVFRIGIWAPCLPSLYLRYLGRITLKVLSCFCSLPRAKKQISWGHLVSVWAKLNKYSTRGQAAGTRYKYLGTPIPNTHRTRNSNTQYPQSSELQCPIPPAQRSWQSARQLNSLGHGNLIFGWTSPDQLSFDQF